MKIGLITDSVGLLPVESALDLAKDQGLSSVEVATGNWSEPPHADLPTRRTRRGPTLDAAHR
jgi:sugar phosphate isomerase/epimerase